jgi:hypothetical protein
MKDHEGAMKATAAARPKQQDNEMWDGENQADDRPMRAGSWSGVIASPASISSHWVSRFGGVVVASIETLLSLRAINVWNAVPGEKCQS